MLGVWRKENKRYRDLCIIGVSDYSLVKCDVMQVEDIQPLLMNMHLNSPPNRGASISKVPALVRYLHPPNEQRSHIQGFL